MKWLRFFKRLHAGAGGMADDDTDEMYFDCPKCKRCERLNNLGKSLYQANPASLRDTKCAKCGHQFDAGPRVKFGLCPGFDYNKNPPVTTHEL
jgi:hypothetical protein